ncbi:MAG: hypothetical protein ACKODX_01805 [Gemmata sp.]
MADQIALTRKQKGDPGVIHFSMKALIKNAGGIAEQLKRVYAEPALVPETRWLAQGEPLPKPEVVRDTANGKPVVRVKAPVCTRFVVVRTQSGETWQTSVRGPSPDGTLEEPVPETGRVLVRVMDRVGRLGEEIEAK